MNSFFWFAGILLALAIWGFVAGDGVIRDPGQVRENGLALLYLAAAALMAVNGWMAHRYAVQAYEESGS